MFDHTVAFVSLHCGAIATSGKPVPGAIDFPQMTVRTPDAYESERSNDSVVLAFHPRGRHKSYFHFMFEILPRVQIALNYHAILGSKATVVVDASSTEAHYLYFLELLRTQTSRVKIVEIDENVLLFPRAVFSVFGLRDYRGRDRKRWDRIHPHSIDLINTFFGDFGSPDGEKSYPKHGRKIYVSRDLAASRRTSNESRIFSLLKERGFERVFLEQMSIRTQVERFREAELVVAIHGAGLSNLAFARRPKVFEIFSPSHLVRPEYFQVTTLVGGSYFYSVGRDKAGHNGVEVSETALDRFLSAAGAT